MSGGILLTQWCNPYGAESGGAKLLLGGQSDASKVFHQWHCDNPAIARYRMECDHGHRGQIMWLCGDHARQFTVRDMTYCPKCNREPPGHKCKLNLSEVS